MSNLADTIAKLLKEDLTGWKVQSPRAPFQSGLEHTSGVILTHVWPVGFGRGPVYVAMAAFSIKLDRREAKQVIRAWDAWCLKQQDQARRQLVQRLLGGAA